MLQALRKAGWQATDLEICLKVWVVKVAFSCKAWRPAEQACGGGAVSQKVSCNVVYETVPMILTVTTFTDENMPASVRHPGNVQHFGIYGASSGCCESRPFLIICKLL